MELILSKKAAKQYLHLPKIEQIKIKKKLLLLQSNPLLGKKLEGELEADRSLRAWPYRIIYEVNKSAKRIEISDILHRQVAYK
jgi:mRNA-degrading endonuclease RelE of RelBE toxin-antitoxin system